MFFPPQYCLDSSGEAEDLQVDLEMRCCNGAPFLICITLHAGKTTLLQILAGQYMVGRDAVRILGRPAFHDIGLTSSGDLSYLGQQWRRDVAFAGYNMPLQVTPLERQH